MYIGWIGCAIWQENPKQQRSQDFFLFNICLIFIYFFNYETIETTASAFLTLIILAIDRVGDKRMPGSNNLPVSVAF